MNKQEIEVLKTAKEYIDRLIVGINEAVDYIQYGNEKNGIEMIPLIAEGIGYIIDVISFLHIELGKEKTIENLNAQLEEIIEGIENNDYVLMSDIFKYEIVPMLEEVKVILTKMS
ncbi:hypothetical protein KPL40_06830 [Clostridium gasigenes]|uniref:hypothetical protein n=1 Tax=Clostridium gasigenes TaxID=94869 RepID=UPI001C0D9AD2|nr:hypothetical protein [Clostridium gasigenes]MBU3132164.1 hypothetical protein [Clostridium gasigenes]